MSEAKSAIGGMDQKHVTAFIGSVLNSGADPLLKAQADILQSVETTMTEWLRRRHEAVVETQTLLARLRDSSDPAEQAKAQQEWAAAAMRRLSADFSACQSASQQLMERAWSWVPRGAEVMAEVTNRAAEVAPRAAEVTTEAARAASKPLRMAAKGE